MGVSTQTDLSTIGRADPFKLTSTKPSDMKRLSSILVLLLFSTAVLMAQSREFPSLVWHKGKIVTANGQVFQGLVKYDLDNNVVQLQNQNMDTFGASNVSTFEIYDETYGGVRTFYTLPYSINGDYDAPMFFEVLNEGNNIALLCREYISSDNRGMGMYGPMMMNPMWGPPMRGGYRLAFNYYFVKNGKIIKYSQKKKELLQIFKEHSDEVELFMRKNRLSHDKRGDLLRITAYYNGIK